MSGLQFSRFINNYVMARANDQHQINGFRLPPDCQKAGSEDDESAFLRKNKVVIFKDTPDRKRHQPLDITHGPADCPTS